MNLMDFNTSSPPLFAAPTDPVNQRLADDIVGDIPPDRFANLETADFGASASGGCRRQSAQREACGCGGEIVATVIIFLALIGAKVVIDRIVG